MRNRPDPGEEGRLLAALAAGDREAAERLVERTYKGVFALLRRLCGDRRPGGGPHAGDLPQGVGRAARLRPPGAVLDLAVPHRLHHLPESSAPAPAPRPLEEKHEATVPDPAPAADEMVGRGMEGDRLRRAVLALPEELRYTVTAVFWGDLPVKEIARQEGITPVGIRKRLKKAFRLLALALEEDAR